MSNPSLFSRRLLLALPLLAVASLALAQNRTLDAPRAAGSIGERYDGFAVLRDQSKMATMASLVEQVNNERRAVYAQRAATDKATVEQVGRIYAAEIFKAAPAGTWFLQEPGQWVKK